MCVLLPFIGPAKSTPAVWTAVRHFFQQCCCCCGSVGLGAVYLSCVTLLDHLIDLGSQLWNPPFILYVCQCVCNSQVHYLLMHMSDKFLLKQPSFNVYRVVTGVLLLHLRMFVSFLTSSQLGARKFGNILLWTFLIQRFFVSAISSFVNDPFSFLVLSHLTKELFQKLSAHTVTRRAF